MTHFLPIVFALVFDGTSAPTIVYPSFMDAVRQGDIPKIVDFSPVVEKVPRRLTAALATSMYGSFDATLQRRIFPAWYCWGQQRTLALKDVPTADFVSVPSNAYMMAGNPNFFEHGASPLGEYMSASNRNFKFVGQRIWKVDALAADAIADDGFGIAKAPLDKDGDFAAHYWMDSASLSSSATYTDLFGSFTNGDPLAHAKWEDVAAINRGERAHFLFVGDYHDDGLLPSGIFGRRGYRHMRQILPEWAKQIFALDNVRTFDDVFPENAQSTSSTYRRNSHDFTYLASEGSLTSFRDTSVDYKTPRSARIRLEPFGLLNSVASLCDTAFLGTDVATWENQMCSSPASDGTPAVNSHDWVSHPLPRYLYRRVKFNGSSSGSVTLPEVQGKIKQWLMSFEGGDDHPASRFYFVPDGWTTPGDEKLSSMTLSGEIKSVTTQVVETVTAGWRDTGGSVNMGGSCFVNVYGGCLRSVYKPTEVPALFPNPIPPGSAAESATWVLTSDYSGRFNELWVYIEPGIIDLPDGTRGPDPNAVIDGFTKVTVGYYYVTLDPSKEVVTDGLALCDVGNMEMFMSAGMEYEGVVPDEVCPFAGPTFLDDAAHGTVEDKTEIEEFANSRSLLPVTFSQELYKAGIVSTRAFSYTAVGVSTNAAIVKSVSEGSGFNATAGIQAGDPGQNRWTSVYTRYAAPTMTARSVAAWQNIWKTFVTKRQIDEDVGKVADAFRSRLEPVTGDPAATAEFEKHALLPTMEAAKAKFGLNAKKALFKGLFKKLSEGDGVAVSFSWHPYEYTFTDGLMPDLCAQSGRGVGTFVFTILDNSSEAVDGVRSSIAVGYDKKGLPFADWQFPAMRKQ